MTKLKSLKEQSLKFLSTLMHNILATVVVSVVGVSVLVSWATGTLSILLQTMQSPMPIWAGISLLLLGCLYICIQLHKSFKLLKKKEPPPKIDFIKNGLLKWKVYLFKNGSYKIDEKPFCIKHDMQLHRFKNGYSCFHLGNQGCESTLEDRNYNMQFKYIEVLAEKKYRHKLS